jgi:hypothetical protein
MAWGSQGQVFLGEDLMHTRDYSEDTSRVIDDEVERILREQEERAVEVLTTHRGGLDALARALLTQETVDGQQVGRLVDEAHGQPVHTSGAKMVPHFTGNGNGTNGANGNGASGTPAPAGQEQPAPAEAPEAAPSGAGAHQSGDQPAPQTWPPPPWPPQAPPAAPWPPPTWPPPQPPSR